MKIKNFTQFILEELEVKGSFFETPENMQNDLYKEVEKIIDQISSNLNILLPIEPSSTNFLKIKNEFTKSIENNQIIQKYVEEYGYDKKMFEKCLLKICCNFEKIKVKSTNKKLTIDKLDFKFIDKEDDVETYQVVFTPDIKEFILNNYATNKLDVFIYITCESERFNRLHFPGRIDRIYRHHGKKFGRDEQPQNYVGRHGHYISNLFDGIPESLRGTGIGYAIYKHFIKFKGYVSSNSRSSSSSQAVWRKMASDKDLFGILATYENGDGDILLFDRNYEGDIKKVCNEFINAVKEGSLYKGRENFSIKNVEIDEDLKKLIQ